MMVKTLVGYPDDEEPEEPLVIISSGATTSNVSSWYSVTEPSVESVVYDCRRQGHLVTEQTIDSIDGLLSGYCEHCSEVFRMQRLPGGLSALRVRALVSALAEEEWKDTTALLLEHASLKKAIEDDAVALRECRGLMEIAGLLFEQRLLGGR